jgi:RecA-family ATPase
MTAAATRILPDNEIPEAMEMEISQAWLNVEVASDDRRLETPQDAAATLYAARKVSLTVHAECDAAVALAIDNELRGMADALFVPSEDAERIFTKAKRQGPASKPAKALKAMNGHTTPEPPTPSPEDYGTVVSITADQIPAPKPQPLAWIDYSNWDREPVPDRQWAIRDRVPLNQAGLFSGEGGTGKSIIELMKDVAHVAGKDWLHSLPEPGPAFYVGAEDDVDELHIRLAAIAAHYGTTFKELRKGGLHVLCLLGQDATLCATTRSGRVETTALYKQILEAAGDIKPKNISVDTLSRAFAGSEIDRSQVYGFCNHMQALAKAAGGSVTVLSHPSLAGMASGSGISGSTAWHGAFRFRQYLKGAKPSDGEQPDNDIREIEFKKNQYGPRAETIVLRYRNGLFLPEGGTSSLEKLARETTAAETFLALLKRFAHQGRNASDTATSPTYAPTAFAKEPEAKKQVLTKPELESAMRRLFADSKIHVENYGKPSRPYRRIAIKSDGAS